MGVLVDQASDVALIKELLVRVSKGKNLWRLTQFWLLIALYGTKGMVKNRGGLPESHRNVV